MATFEIERLCVGAGWRPLVDALHAAILEIAPDYQVGQIKEKFGGLRYYIDTIGADGEFGYDEPLGDRVFGLIDMAEAESFRICEECGEPGGPKNGGWVRTLCNECNAARMVRQ